MDQPAGHVHFFGNEDSVYTSGELMLKADHKNAQTPFKAGQAAVELAVFGAILVFVIGSIMRSAVGNSYEQNQNYKVMRMAMLESWQGAKASQAMGASANISRNSASVLFVEDRLSPDFNKYGDLDRNPFVVSGSGTFTDTLLYPLDVGEAAQNLPVMDVYINGLYFPLALAEYFPNVQLTPQSPPSPIPSTCSVNTPYLNYPLTQDQCLQNECLRYKREWVADPTPGSTKKYKLFYTSEPNGTSNFYSGGPPYCSSLNAVACENKALNSSLPMPDGSGNNVNTDMEYDLQRMGIYDSSNPSFITAASGLRPFVAWQWAATLATTTGEDATTGAEPMIQLDPTNGQYPTYDIDGRLKEVTIYTLAQDPTTGYPTVSYEDTQGGDIDPTWDANSCGPKPGLLSNSQVTTFTQDGTYLQIKEGKMYNPETGQFVRSVDRRNSVDVITREIQLSNNTGRFCPQNVSGALDPQNISLQGSPIGDVGGTNSPNPVEICVDGTGNNICSKGSYLNMTCYDTSTNIIFVRSRIRDRRGHFWMTNASGQLQVQ